MNPDWMALGALVLAAIPCGLFLLNLLAYRAPKEPPIQRRARTPTRTSLSVLIPARNEARNIARALSSVLEEQGEVDLEVLVLDDHSTDCTAEIVDGFAAGDERVRLLTAPPLPPGWCGKQHACHLLAGRASHPVLVFLDADVRLSPGALLRMAAFLECSGSALASGVPRQQMATCSEQLLIPLIHFILLGFLPIHAMRRTRWPALSAGCGQLFVARKDAYLECGGHAMLKDSLHDGIQLPRVFRRAGLATDLFDATDLATCRMYRTDVETWRGLGKNATEGLAAPRVIVPMSLLLLGGQVLPYALLIFPLTLSPTGFRNAVLAVLLSGVPRWIGACRFAQPTLSTFLHPVGVVSLLAIQWAAWFRRLVGRASEWKGRAYPRAIRSATTSLP